MERAALEIALWREVSRHLRIEESAVNLLPLLRDMLGAEGLVVRRLDPVGQRLETAAVAGTLQAAATTELTTTSAGWDSVMGWLTSGTLLHRHANAFAAELPGLLPASVRGDLLGVPLTADGAVAGVLVLHTPKAFEPAKVAMAAVLHGPFAVALANDRRLRELMALTEAAEADRQSLLLRLKRQDISDLIVGAEGGLRGVMQRVQLVARAETPVLILGETGTGKEVVARAIHQQSQRASGPFLRVNCGAIAPELIDSELFGHERGSFTGAVATRKGWFERADGGTLFLDEIGELSAAAQVRLLRILQDGSFQRVGGQQTLTVNVRVIAATNRDLHRMVSEGRFREDVWYRIAVFPIHLPALRERPEDIPTLARHFALRASERLGLAPQAPSPADLALLTAYDWPGNVRELAAVLERAAILGDGKRLEVAAALGVGGGRRGALLPLGLGAGRGVSAPSEAAVVEPTVGPPPGAATLAERERRHIEETLAQTAGRVEGHFGTARILGLNPNTLRGRMRKLGIDARCFRPPAGTPR
jgi:transcriptional regulator with GAF, ATPase, and Fis domain